MLDGAIVAAEKGGEVLAKDFDQALLEREFKDDKTFVTKADKEAEAAIVAVLKAEFPEHGIVGEEGTDSNTDAEFQWVIDPLDGTRNFVNGIPIFAVSLGLISKDAVVAAVVFNPITNSLYSAEKGKGLTYNGRPAHVSAKVGKDGIVSFGPGQKDKDTLNTLMGISENYFRSKRYLGCTALELGYVARGGTEGFVCLGLKKWDYSGGALLVTEAGGTITTFDGGAWNPDQNYFVATNGIAHDAALELVSNLKQ